MGAKAHRFLVLAGGVTLLGCGEGRGMRPPNEPVLATHANAKEAPKDEHELPRGEGSPSESHVDEIGIASWYGSAFAGRRTANGERYDPRLYTAAHKRLPFGTWVEV